VLGVLGVAGGVVWTKKLMAVVYACSDNDKSVVFIVIRLALS
jgi:hypothetical protein